MILSLLSVFYLQLSLSVLIYRDPKITLICSFFFIVLIKSSIITAKGVAKTLFQAKIPGVC